MWENVYVICKWNKILVCKIDEDIKPRQEQFIQKVLPERKEEIIHNVFISYDFPNVSKINLLQ